MPFVKTSQLSTADLAHLRALFSGHPVLRFYLDSALSAREGGIDNRSFLISGSGKGAVLSIDFERVTIRTSFGELAPDELAEAWRLDRKAELHLQREHFPFAWTALRERLQGVKTLRYYLLRSPSGLEPDPRVTSLGPEHLDPLRTFYTRHYPGTIFSSWMLDQPFFGILEQDEILASGGVVAAHPPSHSANLGNFLTRPDQRGRGLAQAVTRTLLHHLESLGFREFTLGTFAENLSACRTYEAVGFQLLEERMQADISAP